MPPNNKKQRGRNNQKKKEAQNAAQKKADAVVRRAQLEAELQGKFGTPAVDTLIRDMASIMIDSPQPAATATATAPGEASTSSSNSTTEKKEDDVVCYHGSSAKYFVAGSAFLRIVKSFVELNKKFHGATQRNDAYNKFFLDRENKQIMYTYEFTNFVFALGVSLYLRITAEEKENYLRLQQTTDIRLWNETLKSPSYELQMIIRLGLTLKYELMPPTIGKKVNEEQLFKYLRDIDTERGIINRLYRETKKQCDCMKTNKKAANKMDKVVHCHACRKVFPKADTKLCERCNGAVYCSEKCSSSHWPHHQQFCRNTQKCTDATKLNEGRRKKNNDTEG